MQVIKPIYEFILWDNCLNNCKFCWQKQQNTFSTDEMRKKSVDLVIDFINSDNFEFRGYYPVKLVELLFPIFSKETTTDSYSPVSKL